MPLFWRRPTDPPALSSSPGGASPTGGFADGPAAPMPLEPPRPQRVNRHALTIVAVILGTLVLATVVFVSPTPPRVTEGTAATALPPVPGTYLDQPPKAQVPLRAAPAPVRTDSGVSAPLDGLSPRVPTLGAEHATPGPAASRTVTAPRAIDDAYRAALRAPPLAPPGPPPTAAPLATPDAMPEVLPSVSPPPDDSGPRSSEPPSVVRALVTSPTAPGLHVLRAGTLIPAVLVFATSSERPGDVLAQVTHDVYASDDARVPLIPAGSKLLGRPQSGISLSQTRLDIVWTRVLLPDGRSLTLPNLGTTDRRGASGVPGRVDQHTGHALRTAALLAGISAGVQLSQPTGTVGVFGAAPSPQQIAAGAVGQQLGAVTTEMLRRQLDVQPTIEIPAGTAINVFVTTDLLVATP
jgi:hypothetical protein